MKIKVNNWDKHGQLILVTEHEVDEKKENAHRRSDKSNQQALTKTVVMIPQEGLKINVR